MVSINPVSFSLDHVSDSVPDNEHMSSFSDFRHCLEIHGKSSVSSVNTEMLAPNSLISLQNILSMSFSIHHYFALIFSNSTSITTSSVPASIYLPSSGQPVPIPIPNLCRQLSFEESICATLILALPFCGSKASNVDYSSPYKPVTLLAQSRFIPEIGLATFPIKIKMPSSVVYVGVYYPLRMTIIFPGSSTVSSGRIIFFAKVLSLPDSVVFGQRTLSDSVVVENPRCRIVA
ncbi:hypothetical protein QVD17_11557 [Tagetes erecta]|uniref:Uncharacterized protein n=1 Tax=Tagetes erecta TaxID=13708 RepID=A0AAD8P253_TARER|nr:hypothetical protein QVD17_11557 [Tagetes erecta]